MFQRLLRRGVYPCGRLDASGEESVYATENWFVLGSAIVVRRLIDGRRLRLNVKSALSAARQFFNEQPAVESGKLQQ